MNTTAPIAGYRGALAIVGTLFFIFGFVTWLNGPLIEFVRLAFDLDADWKAFLVTFAFYIAYFVLALPASAILKRTGMKRGMAIGLLVMAAGSLVFGHFATARDYPLALFGLFTIGSGLALLQTAVNPYISIIGPIESAASRISIMGICNKLAGVLAPIVLGAVALQGLDQIQAQLALDPPAAERAALLDRFAAQIYWPYMAMALLLGAFAVWILRSPLPDLQPEQANASSARAGSGLGAYPHLWLGALCLFLYVGVEVLAGDAIGTYGRAHGLPADQAKYFTSLTLSCMLIGYVIGIFAIPRWLSQERALAASAIAGIVFSTAALLTQGMTSVLCIALLGLANALMWPAIFPLAIRGLGALTERGSAILIMGIAGGALIPSLYAYLKDHFDFQWTFAAIAVPCYLYILFYALVGCRVGFNGGAKPVAEVRQPAT
jgi:FHS family L-fucose permease-like MFS transporter